LKRSFTDVPIWGVKDPRLCRLLPLWLGALSELNCRPQFLLIIRNPAEVAASLEIRDGMAAQRAHLLWLRYVVEMEWWSRPYERVLLSYGALVNDWRGTMDRAFAALGIGLDVHGRQALGDAFMRGDLRHHNLDCCTESPQPGSPMWEEVRSMYHVLKAAVETDLSQVEPMFDEMSTHLSKADRYYADTLAERDRRMHEVQQLLDRQDAESAALRREMSEQVNDIGMLRETLSARDGQIEAMRMELAARCKQTDALEGRVVQAEARLDAVYASHSWQITLPLRAIRNVFRRV
jgi:hypothetical protein